MAADFSEKEMDFYGGICYDEKNNTDRDPARI